MDISLEKWCRSSDKNVQNHSKNKKTKSIKLS